MAIINSIPKKAPLRMFGMPFNLTSSADPSMKLSRTISLHAVNGDEFWAPRREPHV